MAESERVQAVVTYSGSVQGVGFRWTSTRIATDHAVTGTVRNLANGSVELEVQGEHQAVQSYLAALEERFSRNIKGKRVRWGPASAALLDFRVVS